MPLTPQAKEALQVHQVRQNLEGTQGSDDLVFTSPRGTARTTRTSASTGTGSAHPGVALDAVAQPSPLCGHDHVAQGVPIEVVSRCSVIRPSASPPTSMAMCRRRPTGRPRTPWPRLCDEGLRRILLFGGAVPSDEASGDARAIAEQNAFPRALRRLRKCSQVDSHTGYV